MTSRSSSALRKSTAPRKPGGKTSAAKTKVGKLPEWNLADLYSGIDAPEVMRDLQKMDADCVAFETDFKGKLSEQTAAEGGGKWLAQAVRRYEAIDDLAGRLGSYAGLVHAGDSVDPAIEPTLNLLQDRAPEKRKAAGQALATTFKANERTFALITNTLAKDKEISDRWRGFQDVADSRHLANRVEREVVDALVASVRAAYPRLSHRYYNLKAGWFKKKKLAHWDRNAPLPFAATGKIAWPDAQNMVLTAYRGFSPEMASIAEQFFTDRWIDAPVRPGKAPGAFSHPTTPSAHPYVLMNYQGKPRDVMTLAHELGHGVHQVLAAKNGVTE